MGVVRKEFWEVSGEGGVERGVSGERSSIVCVFVYVILYCLCVVGGKCIFCVISVFLCFIS